MLEKVKSVESKEESSGLVARKTKDPHSGLELVKTGILVVVVPEKIL